MPDDLHTSSLLDLVSRYQAGDVGALDLLVRRTIDRVERLARKMLRGFPALQLREETADVLQNALVRLARSLREVTPPSTADFFRLAGEQVRRELLDLARYHRRRSSVNNSLPDAKADPPAPDEREMDRWQALHETVERLPVELREVFSLTFYHDWSQADTARLLGVSDRQVRRLWSEACLRLNDLLGGNLPDA